MPENQKRARVLFVFRRGRKQRYEMWKQGLGPDDFLYGFPFLDPQRYDVSFIEGGDRPKNLRAWLWMWLEIGIVRQLQMGFHWPIAWEHAEQIKHADVIVCTQDSCGLPLAAWKFSGKLKCPLVFFTQGLSDRLESARQRSFIGRWLAGKYKAYFKNIERVYVLGDGAIDSAKQELELGASQIQCLHFGVDSRFWSPGEKTVAGEWVLSVGSDPARDFPTLMQALRDKPMKLVTRLAVSGAGPNVSFEPGLSDVQLREFYRSSRFVVTPLLDVSQPSGQSATLQAMACGKAVILTHTRGLWSTALMKHNENCWLVPPGDVSALSAAIDHLWAHPEEAERIGRNARKSVEEVFDSRQFSKKLDQELQTLLARHAAEGNKDN